MRIAREDLKFERIYLVRPGGGQGYPLEEWAEVVPVMELENTVRKVFG